LIAQALDWLDGQPLRKGEIISARQVENLSYATDIRVPADIGSDASAKVKDLQKPWPPLWIVPAVLAAGLLIIEWCSYQRRWTS
jgi:hypothetical protein